MMVIGLPCSACFNGATAFRQWKPIRSYDCHLQLKLLQWGHRLSAVETQQAQPRVRILLRFNGATAFRQWKHGLYSITANIKIASMGPPPFGSGNYQFRDSRAHYHCGASMGPPPFGSGNEDLNRSMITRIIELQWGHRLSAVETHHKLCNSQARRCFNGATAFRQWKPVK